MGGLFFRALLTTELPTLKRTLSDDDMLSVDMGSSVSSVDDVPHSQHEEYAVTFDLPGENRFVFIPIISHLKLDFFCGGDSRMLRPPHTKR